jgi:hypothetical protein
MWNAAQAEVRKELENPTLRQAILNRANEIKPSLFPWLPVDTRPELTPVDGGDSEGQAITHDKLPRVR